MGLDVLFWPYDEKKSLSRQYPELGRRDEIRALKSHEQLFVWYYACTSSPLMEEFRHDKKARARRAFELTYKDNNYDSKKHADFSSLMFPSDIKAAVDVMSKFRSDIRSQGLAALQASFETHLSVLSEPIPTERIDDETGETIPVKPTDIKNYIEAKKTAQSGIEKLIPLLEEGFGVMTVEEGMDEPTITRFIRDKKLKRS